MNGERPKILLLGRNGQVGWELRRALAPLGEVVALGRGEVNLASADDLRAAVRAHRPAVIVNAAAYTAVDRAEGEPNLAFAINGTAPGVLAEEASRIGALLVHYSTDYVFDGNAATPYGETNPTAPLNVYGESKLAGEQAIALAADRYLILRTSWVYGLRGRNFLLSMLRLFRERDEVRVVDDQTGTPTWSRLIAEATAQVLARGGGGPELRGIYHLASAGSTTWHGFAQAIRDRAGKEAVTRVVTPISSDEYPTEARRPAWSVLATGQLERDFGIVLPGWEHSLHLAMEDAGLPGASA